MDDKEAEALTEEIKRSNKGLPDDLLRVYFTTICQEIHSRLGRDVALNGLATNLACLITTEQSDPDPIVHAFLDKLGVALDSFEEMMKGDQQVKH